jgi:transcriptional regulator GlxA family with amidase domain
MHVNSHLLQLVMARSFDLPLSFRGGDGHEPAAAQKWLRLNEARRLLLAENQDATSAAFQVGYESPSQFSREYSRLFGAPPLRDITSLRLIAPSERV